MDDRPLPPAKRRRTATRSLPVLADDEDEDEVEELPLADDSDAAEANSDDGDESAAPTATGTAPEAGTIEQVVLQDFMCHKHLVVDFGPALTFLTGPNGSGKSAVLVAVCICLGASARFTNRGKKLEDLIRHGADMALIRVRLRNSGRDAYRPRDFGRAIVVERTLRRAGASSFRLLSASNKPVSRSRIDLELMLEQFNVQPDNPCVVLMQDTSRSYLADNNPQSKYKFFLKATQLEKIKEDLELTKEQLDKTSTILAHKQLLLDELGKEVDRQHREVQDAKQVLSCEEELKNLRNQQTWALIQDAEKELDECNNIVQLYENKIRKRQSKLDRADEFEQTVVSELRSVSEELAQLTQAVESVGRSALTERQRQTKRRKQAEESEIHSLKYEFEQIEGRRTNVLRGLREEQERAQREDQTARRQAKVADLQRVLADQQQKVADSSGRLQQLSRSVDEAGRRCEEVGERKRRVNDELSHSQQKLQRLRSQTGNRLLAFGKHMPQLVDAIRRAPFKDRPRGPIGALIGLKEQSWAAAVESALGPVLDCFVVSNIADEKTLLALARERDFHIDLIVQHPSRRHAVPAFSPPPQFTRLLDVIEVPDDLVFNVIVDHARAELAVLTRDHSGAVNFVRSNRTYTAFFENGTRFSVREHSESHVIGTGKSTRMAASPDAEIRELEESIRRLEGEAREFDRQLRAAGAEKSTAEAERRRVRSQLHEAETAVSAAQEEIGALESQVPVEANSLNEMHEALQRYDEEIKQLQEKIVQQRRVIEEVTDELRQLQAEDEEKRQEEARLSERIEQLNETLRSLQAKEKKTEMVKRQLQTEFATLETECNSRRQQRDEFQEKLKGDMQMALSICPERIRVDRSAVEIDRDMNVLKMRIELQTNGRSIQSIFREYRRVKSSFDAVKTTIERVTNLRDALQAHSAQLQNDWRKYLHSLARRTRACFNAALSYKGYSGALEFDHARCTLDIQVQLDKARSLAEQRKQTARSLSGGERSYTTVSLLIALWEVMETPFIAMDEFDVFMDQVNRMKSSEVLLQAARMKPTRQYIFITPQSLAHIAQSDDVCILAMTPARPLNDD